MFHYLHPNTEIQQKDTIMKKSLQVLIIEDNESDAALIIRYLQKAEFILTYEVVETSSQMESALEKCHWDFAICDYTLPQFNAFNALKLLQASGHDIPFIVVSGTIGEETAVEIMKAGAHDYILKNNFSRLVPVINRELKEAAIRREHKKAEERIRIQAHLLDLIGQSVITVNKNFTITYWNKASEELYGWTASEAIGFKLMDKLVIHFSNIQSLEIMTCIANGESWSGEFIIQKRDNSTIPVQVTSSPILDENGLVNGIIGISFDISERKKTEEEIMQKMEELASSNKELNRIIRLTIGREMRMIELKRHCNNLAKQLGIKQPYPLAFLNEPDHQKDS
jgi:PAS domain S-box-containing protein